MYKGLITYHKKGEKDKYNRFIEGKTFREFLTNYNCVFYPLIEKKIIIDNILITRITKEGS